VEFIGWVFIVVALSTIGLVMYRWNWLMKSHRVRFMVKLFKEPGAKIFYVLVGFALMVIGSLLVTDVW
jgi:hypothetical protein